MTMTHEIEDSEYMGYRITVKGGVNRDPSSEVAGVKITFGNGESVCRFSESLRTLDYRRALLGGPVEAPTLVEYAFHKARGAILLDRLSELDGQQGRLKPDPQYAQRSEGYLRSIVLGAFKRVYRHNPSGRGRINFDAIGVALMENVETKEIEYVLERLEGDRLISSFADQHEPGNRPFMPTALGLQRADELSHETKAPGLLFEETVVEVERVLGRHAPDLVARLRAMSRRVAEASVLTHIDVGEIAQSCDLVLQDFLDLPVLWRSIKDPPPPKDRTKIRLELILKAMVPSETERELAMALTDYLKGWFGPLDKFVNKHRHPTEKSARLHAKRLVLYTYQLLADLIEVLGL
jgi:hypothetical protein